jgi:hypothetical protein
VSCTATNYADDYCEEPCESWSEATVTARKRHHCSECSTAIQPGERYERATGLLRGDGWQTWRRCMVCVALQEAIVMVLDTCVPYGALRLFCDEDIADEDLARQLNFGDWQRRHGNWPAAREATP